MNIGDAAAYVSGFIHDYLSVVILLGISLLPLIAIVGLRRKSPEDPAYRRRVRSLMAANLLGMVVTGLLFVREYSVRETELGPVQQQEQRVNTGQEQRLQNQSIVPAQRALFPNQTQPRQAHP